MAPDMLAPMNDVYWKRARSALSAADPVMAGLVARYGHIAFCPSGSVIESIFRAVIGQQISNRAAATLWDRFEHLKTGAWECFAAVTPSETFYALGLNPRKTAAIKDVAFRFIEGDWSEERFGGLSDAEVVSLLTQVKGIGPWSATSVLIFGLARGDVFAIGDFGVRQALVNLYFPDETVQTLNRKAQRSRVELIANAWAPYRTAATWFLWRSLENDLPR